MISHAIRARLGGHRVGQVKEGEGAKYRHENPTPGSRERGKRLAHAAIGSGTDAIADDRETHCEKHAAMRKLYPAQQKNNRAQTSRPQQESQHTLLNAVKRER